MVLEPEPRFGKGPKFQFIPNLSEDSLFQNRVSCKYSRLAIQANVTHANMNEANFLKTRPPPNTKEIKIYKNYT